MSKQNGREQCSSNWNLKKFNYCNFIVLWVRQGCGNTPKRCPFHYRGLECKSRKLRNTGSNGQIWPWSTEWSRTKTNRVLPREHTGHSKHPLPTKQEKTLGESDFDTKIRLIIFFAAKEGEALCSQQKQDQELTVAQIMNSLLPNSDLNCVQYSSAFIPSGYHISDSLV